MDVKLVFDNVLLEHGGLIHVLRLAVPMSKPFLLFEVFLVGLLLHA